MYKDDLALNNPYWLIYHEIQPNQKCKYQCVYLLTPLHERDAKKSNFLVEFNRF